MENLNLPNYQPTSVLKARSSSSTVRNASFIPVPRSEKRAVLNASSCTNEKNETVHTASLKFKSVLNASFAETELQAAFLHHEVQILLLLPQYGTHSPNMAHTPSIWHTLPNSLKFMYMYISEFVQGCVTFCSFSWR